MLKWIKCFFKMFTKNRRCVDCDYMRCEKYGRDAGLWRCTASCGNNEGKICGAWFPRTPGRESPDKYAKFYKVHKGGSPC